MFYFNIKNQKHNEKTTNSYIKSKCQKNENFWRNCWWINFTEHPSGHQ